MSSDVCKHCTHAACLDVCPTGAIFRTEFGTVVVQDDICNGCGYCVPACPYGVLDKREDDGRVFKCTLCYDRLGSARSRPAPRPARPTRSSSASSRSCASAPPAGSQQLHEAGVAEARLYGHDPERRRRRRRRVLPAARRARGLRAAARSGRDHAGPGRMWRNAAIARRRAAALRGVAVGSSGRATMTRAAAAHRDPPTSARLLLRHADHQPARLGGARDRRLPVHRRAGGRLVDPRGRRRPHAAARARAPGPVRGQRGDRRLARGADQRPRPPGALPQHAAGVQADLADERRHLDPLRLRAAELPRERERPCPGERPWRGVRGRRRRHPRLGRRLLHRQR